jgi:PIN domain nuclease of toxin-antitoxin system
VTADAIGGRILDTGALVAAARGDLYMRALLATAHAHVIPLLAPATCVADASADLHPHGRDALTAIMRFPLVAFAALDEAQAVGSGILRSAHRPAATTLGHVAYLAAARQWPVITAAPGPLRALYPSIAIEHLPTA